MADKGPTWHGARRRLDFGTDPPRVTRVEAVVRIPQHSMSIGSLESQPGGDNLLHTRQHIQQASYRFNITQTITMAGFTFTSASASGMVNFGRSGYNKDGDSEDDKRNFGRSGYNKDGDSEDDKKNFGRSGYNKGNDDEDDSRQFNFGRSGYN
ncbi:hypothetical protein F4820DRAFT_453252 [Hypoxylon rubiginosum]|uniref:Uncharacterized protein n=1 Tax=Hypoxylon rubiginosum TaxID=110542 RepID=A0ACB9YL57_9PEZI|nr:hypothetical protein F4820DRAFT_453252 [Hypoxylon rubiginosum]